jgi:hypothetical protein
MLVIFNFLVSNKTIKIYLDENANDLDFEDSLDKNHATPALHNESMRTALSKQSLLNYFLFNKKFII